MTRPNVLLLGGDGQLGQDIQQAHRAAGEPFSLTKPDRRKLDVTAADFEDRLAALPFDALVNCTGYHQTDEAEDNATLAFAVNAHAVQRMARACAKRNARLLHVSTDYVFGGDVERRTPLTENDRPAPVNVYGASKAMGETLAALESERVLILRVASLFGVAGSRGKGGNFVETMLRVGRETGSLRVVADQFMSPTATADVADVVIELLRQPDVRGIFHVVNAGTASWFDFASAIIRRSHVEAEVSPCRSADWPTRALRPRFSALDSAKIAALRGPMRTWQEALDDYLRHRRRSFESTG